MSRRRTVGSVYRRRRAGKKPDGLPKTGYHPGWYMRLRRNGREICRYAGPDRRTALDVLERTRREHDRLELLDEQPKNDLAFEAFAETYLTWSKRAHTTSTYQTRKSVIRALLIPAFKGLKLDAITPVKVEHFIAKRRATVSGATCNRNLAVLSSVLKRAIKLGFLTENPVAKVERDREAITPLLFLDHDEQARLIDEIPAQFRTFYLTALDTGLRLSELLRSEWGDVDLSGGRVRVRLSKNKRGRTVHATGRVQLAHRELHANRMLPLRGPDLVFPDAGSKGYLRSSWRSAFKKAAARVGRPELRIHDLRHLTAINLIRAGMDLPSVQAVLGHVSLISTLRYAAYQDNTAPARAAALLDAVTGWRK